MPSFRSAKSQASHIVKQNLSLGKARHTHRAEKKIHSIGTGRSYIQALTRIAHWIQQNKCGDLKRLTPKVAIQYLEWRGQSVSQKTLDQERQAMQMHLGNSLPVIKSELAQVLKSRAYTFAQVELVAQAQTEKHQLATRIALAAGLRAHELLTLQRVEERSASTYRRWSKSRFHGRTGQRYTVQGKGGLIREVLIPKNLAQQLEQQCLAQPIIKLDRTIKYRQHYNLGGGKAWSSSFSAASKRCLGWSHGAHGLRHTYAQVRMDELQGNGFCYEDALGIVSQELGHFRPDITEVYLR